jgi:2-methylcitrate dehydratase
VDHIQEQLAHYAAGIGVDAIPRATLHEACVRVIDTLGALIGGFADEPCRMARALAADMPVAAGASIIGTRVRAPLDVAAFVNGTTSRSAEINDVYHRPGSKNGHPSDVIMPLLAVAEHAHISGRDFLAGVAIAYEIYLRFADQFDSRAFDATNFCSIAVAAVAGRLLGLPRAQIAEAISIAAVPNNALNQSRTGHLTMWKSVAAGQAGRAGVFAALLAQKGMRGAHEPFTGKHGWCNNVARKTLSFDVVVGGGVEFKIHETIIKPRMACLHTLAPILAPKKRHQTQWPRWRHRVRHGRGLSCQRARGGHTGKSRRCGSPLESGFTRNRRSQHSYCVAATLRDGSVTSRSFDDAHLRDPLLRGVLAKTELVENAAYTVAYEKMPVQYRCRVTATLRDGEQIIGETGGEHGDLSEHKSDDEIAMKFRTFVTPQLGVARTDFLLEKLWQLQSARDMAEIPPLFVMRPHDNQRFALRRCTDSGGSERRRAKLSIEAVAYHDRLRAGRRCRFHRAPDRATFANAAASRPAGDRRKPRRCWQYAGDRPRCDVAAGWLHTDADFRGWAWCSRRVARSCRTTWSAI